MNNGSSQPIGPITAVLTRLGATGRDKAVKRAEIAQALLGRADTSAQRQVSRMLEAERQTTVICSGSEGIWLPSGCHDVEACYRLHAARARGIFRSMQTARRYILEHGGQVEGQLNIFDAEGERNGSK